MLNNTLSFQSRNSHINRKNSSWFFCAEHYILFAAVFIEIVLIVFFSFTTKNVYSDSISLFLIVFFTFPLGFLVSRLLFSGKNISETIILSICIGLPFSAGLWGLMAFMRIPINFLIYFMVTFAIPTCLLIYFRKTLRFKDREININELCVPIIVFLIAFLWHSLMYANKNVPGDVDAQGPGYIQFLMKYQGYPIVYPFLNGTRAYINYPPCFNVFVVLLSKLKMSLIHKECMAITVVCGSYFVLANFLLAYYLANRNLLLAFVAGVLTLNRAYLTQISDGNTTEMLSFFSIPCFLVLLQHALNEKSKKLSAIIAAASGIVVYVSAFSQTEIFDWYAISLAAYFFWYLISVNKSYFKDYLVLTITIFTCIVFVMPWLVTVSGNYKTVDFNNLFSQMATHLIPALRYWHNPVFLVLSFAGIGIFFFRREKIMVFLGMHAVIMAGLIVHWKLYRLIGFKWFQFTPTPNWWLGANGNFTTPFQFPNTYTIGWMAFTTVFPIATACTLVAIIGLIRKKVKTVFVEKYKILFIPIMIFLSLFQYYEYKYYLRYPEFLLETDYQTLQWFQKNTSFEDCLILNPRNPIPLPNGITYWSSDWVPIIAERRAISCRSLDIAGHFQMKFIDTDSVNKNALLDVYNNILQPGAYDILKKFNITHIFISALQTANLIQDYQKAPFLQLAHYHSIPNMGTSVIYKVK